MRSLHFKKERLYTVLGCYPKADFCMRPCKLIVADRTNFYDYDGIYFVIQGEKEKQARLEIRNWLEKIKLTK